MPLKITGNVLVDATRDEVWKLIFDLDFMKPIIDEIPGVGVERLVQVSEEKYEGTATIGVAMIKGKYDGTITILEKRAPEYVQVRGDGKGGGNWTSGNLALTLTEQEGKTLMAYEGTGNLSGPLASVGQRLIDTVGKQFIAHGTKAFADQLAARSREMEKHAMTATPGTVADSAAPVPAMSAPVTSTPPESAPPVAAPVPVETPPPTQSSMPDDGQPK